MADPLRATFRKPFAEQVAAFRLRLGNLVPTQAWDDLQGRAHDRAFMVAGAMEADLLADLASAVDKAISEGTGIEAFRKDFRAIVERRGWHNWTGEGSAKGEAWRTKVIYRTNMATSMAAGRWAQLVAGKFKYLIYEHSGAAHPRLDHLSWDHLVLPFEHPFWKTHYPPNGWGCGCRARGAHTLAGARRVGGDTDKALPPGWDAIDPKTGVQLGIGKGWDHAPGASVAETINAMAGKTVSWPFELTKAYMADLPASTVDDFATGYRSLPSLADDVRRYVERALGVRGGKPISKKVIVQRYKTLGRLTSDQVASARKSGIDAAGYDFSVDPSAIIHIFKAHGNIASELARGNRAVTAADIARLVSMLDGDLSVGGAGSSVRTGQPLVQYIIKVGAEEWIAVFERRAKRRMLALKTFYIRVKR